MRLERGFLAMGNLILLYSEDRPHPFIQILFCAMVRMQRNRIMRVVFRNFMGIPGKRH